MHKNEIPQIQGMVIVLFAVIGNQNSINPRQRIGMVPNGIKKARSRLVIAPCLHLLKSFDQLVKDSGFRLKRLNLIVRHEFQKQMMVAVQF